MIHEDKKILRRSVRSAIKEHWTPLYRRTVSSQICSRIESLPLFNSCTRIALYRAMPDEVDLSPLLDKYLHDKTLLIPRVEGDDLINFYRYEPDTLEVSQDYHIEEPTAAASTAYDPADIELILVPGLAFDRSGMRLGRGKGYYDRYFVRCPQAIRLAVVSTDRLVDRVPADDWDVAMHAIVTDQEYIDLR